MHAPSSTDGPVASPPEPFVAPDRHPAEFTLRALLLGSFFGVVFGAVTVYLALKVGLTVSASIPISVLSIVIFRRLGRSTILENNLVQTVGSAGESIAAGVVFTLPALVFLNAPMPYHRVFLLALSGGVLGVLMMIPLRRALIVREHASLRYPEGTACAHILIAGEKGGTLAGRVFAGLGVGVVYKMIMSVARQWKEVPGFVSTRLLPGLSLSVEASPELLGVGYIVGFRTAAVLVAGGLLSWGVLIPMVKFLGSGMPAPLFPSLVPIAQMSPSEIWSSYVRYVGAGAVAAGGLINLARALPTIWGSFRDSLRALSDRSAGASTTLRTERDLPISIVFVGSILLVVCLFLLIHFDLNPGHLLANLVASLLIVVYGFFFVTVSARVVGTIGASNNPISGDTITTLMGTCLLFVLVGWTGHAYAAVALSIGAVVCIAAANAGGTSQDLKTGFLIGATPRAQQLGLILGVLVSVGVIGVTLRAMNEAYRTLVPMPASGVAPAVAVTRTARGEKSLEYHGQRYEVVYLQEGESGLVPSGKYLVDDKGQIAFRYVDGIGGQTLAAPQARLMSLVISGILERKLPWTLVLLGLFIGIVMELCGVPALPFAVGVYLPISTSTPVFFGGLCRLLADRIFAAKERRPFEEGEASEGMLFSSGLIAGGALMGLGVAVLILASGRFVPVANALEWLRRDRIQLALVPALSGRVKLDGQPVAPDAQFAVRTRRFGSELRPAYRRDGRWQPFDTVRLEIVGDDPDVLVLTPDPEKPVRRIDYREIYTWDRAITVDNLGVGVGRGSLVRWLVEDGDEVAFGQPLAEVSGATQVILRAAQRGRLHRDVAEGHEVAVHASIGRLELREPPVGVIGMGPPPTPTQRRRLVVDPQPSSDWLAVMVFMALGALAVAAARPQKVESSSDSPTSVR